jgi:DNA gyrase subunit A
VSCDAIATDSDLLLVTDSGYGKRTKAAQFNVQARGGQGVRAITLSEKRGFVVAAFMTSINDEIILISSGGVTIRTAVREIASQGRSATGVRVMNLDAGQNVAAATPVMGADDQ